VACFIIGASNKRAIKEVAMMKKTIAAGTIALMLAGAGAALAQSAPPREGMRMRQSAEDVAAFTDARIAALKAGLKLTAEQEKNWPAAEAAIRDLSRQRADRMKELADRMAARRDARASGNVPPRPDAIERLRRGADAMTRQAAALKHLADAVEPLYKSLDDGQKRRFGTLLRVGGGERMHERMHGRWQRRG
jgi:zinc resistance-associated protein